jgi:hypothetical protein
MNVIGRWATSTTIANVHRGAVLPAARVIIVVVPITLAALFWLLVVKRRR